MTGDDRSWLGDKRHLNEAVVSIRGKKRWLWRAVDQDGFVLEVLVQGHRNAKTAKRLMRKRLRNQGRAPRVMVTDKLPTTPQGGISRQVSGIAPTKA